MSERLIFSRTLQGIEPVYRSFTPTWTNLTVGNATQDFEFANIGKFVHYQGILTFGSTTSISGGVSVNCPISQDNSIAGFLWPVAGYTDQGVQDWAGAAYLAGGTSILLGTINVAGTYGTWTQITNTIPFTWGTGDFLRFSVYYKAA